MCEHHRRLPRPADDTSPELADVLQRCLAKVREARYPSVHELEEALSSLAPDSAAGRARRRRCGDLRPDRVPPAAPNRRWTCRPRCCNASTRAPRRLGVTALAPVARGAGFRAKPLVLLLVSVSVLCAAATLVYWLRTPTPELHRTASSPAALPATAVPEGRRRSIPCAPFPLPRLRSRSKVPTLDRRESCPVAARKPAVLVRARFRFRPRALLSSHPPARFCPVRDGRSALKQTRCFLAAAVALHSSLLASLAGAQSSERAPTPWRWTCSTRVTPR